jgi:hypothetical protein
VLYTPNTLTEASNIAAQISEPARQHILAMLKRLIENGKETHIPSIVACSEVLFTRLGLTDAVLLNLARSGIAILTVDLDLYLAAERAGFEAINFTHHIDAAR